MDLQRPIPNQEISADWGAAVADKAREQALTGDGVARTPAGTSIAPPPLPGAVRGDPPTGRFAAWLAYVDGGYVVRVRKGRVLDAAGTALTLSASDFTAADEWWEADAVDGEIVAEDDGEGGWALRYGEAEAGAAWRIPLAAVSVSPGEHLLVTQYRTGDQTVAGHEPWDMWITQDDGAYKLTVVLGRVFGRRERTSEPSTEMSVQLRQGQQLHGGWLTFGIDGGTATYDVCIMPSSDGRHYEIACGDDIEQRFGYRNARIGEIRAGVEAVSSRCPADIVMDRRADFEIFLNAAGKIAVQGGYVDFVRAGYKEYSVVANATIEPASGKNCIYLRGRAAIGSREHRFFPQDESWDIVTADSYEKDFVEDVGSWRYWYHWIGNVDGHRIEQNVSGPQLETYPDNDDYTSQRAADWAADFASDPVSLRFTVVDTWKTVSIDTGDSRETIRVPDTMHTVQLDFDRFGNLMTISGLNPPE